MRATQLLRNLGQSIWLDNITRDLLNSGALNRYVSEFCVTGLTSNPTIFERAIRHSAAYDAAIRRLAGNATEDIFFDLALDDLTRAADLFRPIHEQTNTVDGWVSLEVSPLLAYDTDATLRAARELFARAARPNLFINIPGTEEGLPAIEEAIFAGVPVNVTLLFSREQYLAAAEAFLRGIERRLAAGLNPNVGSVASVFVSRWDAAVADNVPRALRNQLGIAIAGRTYRASRAQLSSPRWQRIYNAGARPSVSSGPAPAQKTGLFPTSSMSKPWLLHSRSTPCRRAHCLLSPNNTGLAPSFRPTAATARLCWRALPRSASISRGSPSASSRMEPHPSPNHGVP